MKCLQPNLQCHAQTVLSFSRICCLSAGSVLRPALDRKHLYAGCTLSSDLGWTRLGNYQQCLQCLERLVTCVGPSNAILVKLSCQVHQWSCYSGVMGNKPGKTQEGANLLLSCWHRPSQDSLHIDYLWIDLSIPNNMAKVHAHWSISNWHSLGFVVNPVPCNAIRT